MMTLKDYMEVVGYRVTEGSEYIWQSFGANAYRLSSWSGAFTGSAVSENQPDYSIEVVFDTANQTVYQVEAHDYENNRAYRLTNPDFLEAFNNESKERNIDPKEAWDDVKFVDLELATDFLEKAKAISLGEDYDTRVEIPLELDDDLLFLALKDAHAKDMTFNQYVEEVLRVFIEDQEKLKEPDNG